jgi:hypothetical protein
MVPGECDVGAAPTTVDACRHAESLTHLAHKGSGNGWMPSNMGRMVSVPEVCREDAKDADDVRAKLAAWRRARGWT